MITKFLKICLRRFLGLLFQIEHIILKLTILPLIYLHFSVTEHLLKQKHRIILNHVFSVFQTIIAMPKGKRNSMLSERRYFFHYYFSNELLMDYFLNCDHKHLQFPALVDIYVCRTYLNRGNW